jgi:hypothetical protein
MTTRRTRKRTPKAEPEPVSKIKQIFKWIQAEEQIEHFKYILNRLFYLLMVLCMGFIIQWVWNTIMDLCLDGQYQINMFEAAILWVCVY